MASAADFQGSTRFRLLGALLILVVCDGSCSLLLPQLSFLKYAFFLAILAVAAATFLINLSLTTYPLYPLGFLVLSLVSMVTLGIGQGEGERISYSSALFPMMLVGFVAFIPEDQSRLDFGRTLRFFEKFSLIFVLMHVAAQVVFLFWKFTWEDWFTMTIHENTFFAIFALCLSALQRRWRVFCVLSGLIVLSLLLRPSSSFMAGLTIGLCIAFGFVLQRRALTMAVGNLLLLVLVLFPVIFVTMPDFTDLIYGIEPMVKEDLLGSTSNNPFRMVVLKLAREAILSTPWAIGQGFVGTTNVNVGLVIDGWTGGEDPGVFPATGGQAPVHSDFLIMLWQGGALGYGIFALSLLGAIRHLGRSLAIAEAAGAWAAVTLLQSIYILILVFSIFISFNPVLQKYTFSYLFWFPLLILALACREIRFWGEERVNRGSAVAIRMHDHE
jgi:hypothetical protein